MHCIKIITRGEIWLGVRCGQGIRRADNDYREEVFKDHPPMSIVAAKIHAMFAMLPMNAKLSRIERVSTKSTAGRRKCCVLLGGRKYSCGATIYRKVACGEVAIQTLLLMPRVF